MYQENEDGGISYSTELRKLLRSSADEFLCLLRGIRTNSQEYDVKEKTTIISDIFSNMAFLLNSMRPHQARQSIISILQHQIDRRNQQADELERYIEEADAFMKEHGVTFDEDGEPVFRDISLDSQDIITEDNVPMEIDDTSSTQSSKTALENKIAELRASHNI